MVWFHNVQWGIVIRRYVCLLYVHLVFTTVVVSFRCLYTIYRKSVVVVDVVVQ